MNKVKAMVKKQFLLSVLFISVVFYSSPVFSQDLTSVNGDSSSVKQGLSIDEISNETESLRSRISDLKGILKPSTQTIEVDSIVDTAYVEIMVNRDSLYSEMYDLTRRDLKIRLVRWGNYKSKLKSLQNTLSNRAQDITAVNDELVDELSKWLVTKEELLENSESENVFASLDTMITTLNSLIDVAHIRLDSVFTVQKRLTELILVVDEANSEIDRVVRQKQKDYFVIDSDPLWEIHKADTALTDSNQVAAKSMTATFMKGLNQDVTEFKRFVAQNGKSSLIQLLFLLAIYMILIQMRRKWNRLNSNNWDKLDMQTRGVFKYPLAATLVVGVLISINFYTALIPVLGEFHVVVVFVATIVLLPQITVAKIRIFLLLLLGAYFIEVVDVYFEPKSAPVRWFQIFEASLMLIALVIGKNTIKNHPENFDKIAVLFRFVVPVYMLMLAISIVLNVIGMVNLSNMFTAGVMLSVILGMVVFLAIKIVTSIMVMYFELRKLNHNQALSVMVEATNKRFQPTLVWIGIIIWLMYTLIAFDVFDNLIIWLTDLLHVKWEIGNMKIEVGSIMSFFFLLIMALVFAKMIATIFQDEWMIQSLPRGVAPAISLILRIITISIGMYLAFTSAGIDLGELGFIFGALGVGIGFGLQNVVLNFIAGLILAFERPINLGDAIEVDQESGVVTSIGVRSSNIRTWSGAEAIIPNGDLISKKVINWTLSNRDRRSKVLMRTAPTADPDLVIALFNEIASSYDVVFNDPAPKTYFYGYDDLGNLSFALLYWTSFSDTLKTDSAIAMEVFKALKEKGIDAPMPNQRNFE